MQCQVCKQNSNYFGNLTFGFADNYSRVLLVRHDDIFGTSNEWSGFRISTHIPMSFIFKLDYFGDLFCGSLTCNPKDNRDGPSEVSFFIESNFFFPAIC